MRFNTLEDWLSWQESLNPKEIDLGLDRVEQVLQQLGLSSDYPCPVITVAGTNGKGSTVALIESILVQAGKNVGCYTSPHIFKYNERIRINQQDIDDASLCVAFDAVDRARGEIPLTYFEFGTLAALQLFQQHQLDVVVLEVGLGGRLDAVNVIDADVAVITSIGIDHVDWLGNSLDSIAREKAGIMRADRPCIIAMMNPPPALLESAETYSARVVRLGHEYLYQKVSADHWQLRSDSVYLPDLPLPALKGGVQLQNAAAAVMAVNSLPGVLVDNATVGEAMKAVSLSGRYQQLAVQPEVRVDVAHNEQAATQLAALLADNVTAGRTLVVVAMLSDKAVDKVIDVLSSEVDHWFTAGLDVPRGLSAKNMAEAVRAQLADDTLTASETVGEACRAAMQRASADDRLIIFGSFYTVNEAMTYFSHRLK